VNRIDGYENVYTLRAQGEADAACLACTLAYPPHTESTLRVVHKRVNVVVKPMTTISADCRQTIACCLHFERTNSTAIETIKTGGIGNPRISSIGSSSCRCPARKHPSAQRDGQCGHVPAWRMFRKRHLQLRGLEPRREKSIGVRLIEMSDGSTEAAHIVELPRSRKQSRLRLEAENSRPLATGFVMVHAVIPLGKRQRVIGIRSRRHKPTSLLYGTYSFLGAVGYRAPAARITLQTR
jgi:hypothetical protein